MVKSEAESPEIIKRRWDFKKEQIEILANNIQKLRYNVTLGLKDSDNEKVFLTALVVAIILETSERVGNEASASNDRVGITGLKKKQVSIEGNKVTLEYTGKSGVEHIKSFSDEKIAKALKLAIKHSKTDDVFCTSEGFKVKSMRVNNFLSDFSVRSKDIRGYQSNNIMLDKLKNSDVEDDESKRKKFFMQSLRKVAIKIGHGASTLRKHYLIPELEINYIKNGTIINLNERDSYKDGGEISKTPAPKEDKVYGSEINKVKSAESKDKAISIILNPNIIKSIVSIIHKYNEEYPNKKVNVATAKAVVRRGMGAYSSTHRPTISGGKSNSRVAWGLARLNAFVYKIQNGKSKSGKYNQDDDLIDELGYDVESYSNRGSLKEYLKRNNLEDNSYTEEDMDNFTNELNDELKKIGYITRVSKSKTDFGKSNYVFATNDVGNLYTPNEIKIRISDHSVTNIDRIFNEFHISFPLKDKENSIKGALNKVKYYFDRDKHFYSKPIKVEKKAYNVLAETPNETDIITKEWTTKKGKKMHEVTRTYSNEAIGYFSKDNDRLYDTVFTETFNNGGEILKEKVTFDNFYKDTIADFKEIMKEGVPKRKPDFISDFGSKYWFTSTSIIRQSDHWGKLDTCTWTLDGKSGNKYTQGICKLIDFQK